MKKFREPISIFRMSCVSPCVINDDTGLCSHDEQTMISISFEDSEENIKEQA